MVAANSHLGWPSVSELIFSEFNHNRWHSVFQAQTKGKHEKMKSIENQVSAGEVITLDDKHFINCQLRNCTLFYSGGDFALTNTKVENCQVTLSGAAQRTVALLGMVGALSLTGPAINPPRPNIH
jgi:hypothetical protein